MASLLWAGKTPALAPDSTDVLYNGTPRGSSRKKKTKKTAAAAAAAAAAATTTTTTPRTTRGAGRSASPSFSSATQKANALARANHLSARVDSRLMPNEFASAVEDARLARVAEASLAAASPMKMSWSELQTKERYIGFQTDGSSSSRNGGGGGAGAPPSRARAASAGVTVGDTAAAAAASNMQKKRDLLKLKPNWVGVHHIVATASATAGDVAWASRLRQSPKHAGRNIVAGTTPPRLHLGARSGGGGGAILKASGRASSLSEASHPPDLQHVKAKVDTGRSRPPPSRPKSRLDSQTKTKAVVVSASQRTSNLKFTSAVKEPVAVEKRAAPSNNSRSNADAIPAAKKMGSVLQTSKALQNIDKLTSRLDAFSSHKVRALSV
jgi:hypothetical protein